jgi:hypothetical protein
MAAAESPQLRPLRDYADRIPGHRRGTRTHPSTLIRFCTAGVKAPDGTQIRLRAVRLGHRWLTTDEWFAAFLSALTPADGPTTVPVRSPAARTRAAAAAERELTARGG